MRSTLTQAILAAFCAILCNLSALGGGGMMLGARTAAWSGGGGSCLLGYTTEGLVAMWDAIDNEGTGTHNPGATTWKDVSGNGHDLNTIASGGFVNGNGWNFNKQATGIAKSFNVEDIQTVSFCCDRIYTSRGDGDFMYFGSGFAKKLYFYVDRFICNSSTTYGPAIDKANIKSMTVQFLNGTMSGKPLNPSWEGDTGVSSYKTEYVSGSGAFSIGKSIWDGKMHNVRIYNKFLTQDEITANWNNDKTRFGTT